MDLTHHFSVPTPVEETWGHFQDIASVAECFPGAQVTSAEEDSFSGTVKVKLGPIALVYTGSGTFVEKDDTAHRFVVDAKGKDKRGNGTAGAKVTLTMDSTAAGGTDVSVHTDLAITGKPAQFGRGVMQDVSDKLLGQFVSCLEQRMGEGDGSTAEAPPAAVPTEGAPPAAPAAPAPPSAPAEPAVAADAAAAAAAPAPAEPVATPAATSATPGARKAAAPAGGSDDALDLGKTVLPILAKSYWKQAVAGV